MSFLILPFDSMYCFIGGGGGGYGGDRGSGDMVTQEDTIFIQGMDPGTTEDELCQHFGAIGIIKVRFFSVSYMTYIRWLVVERSLDISNLPSRSFNEVYVAIFRPTRKLSDQKFGCTKIRRPVNRREKRPSLTRIPTRPLPRFSGSTAKSSTVRP